MKSKAPSLAIALIVAIIFLFFAVKPGAFNMIGYSISLLIFPENSPNSLKYSDVVIYSFDVLCALLLFWLVYKLVKKPDNR